MQWWELALILGTLATATGAFIWVVLSHNKAHGPKKTAGQQYAEAAEHDVEHIFNDEFREELRNRGRLHFEKIIGENAMFLQQDLRLTTSQLNDYMKSEITRTLQEEFAKYEQSITDAKQIAQAAISKTTEALEQQRQMLSRQLEQQLQQQRAQMLQRFEQNMADIINHYVLAAIGNQIDLTDQLDYILNDLEANKQAILEDLSHGA